MNLYIVTGASKGLGLSFTNFAIENGHRVIGISRSRLEPREGFYYLQTDLRNTDRLPEAISAAVNKISTTDFKSIHLINNAGMIEPINFTKNLSASEIRQNIEVNLIAPIVLTSSFLKATSEFPGWRTIVNISSGVAENPKANWSVYSAAKAGLRGHSLALAQEFTGTENIRVVCLSPGIMDTDMQAILRAQTTDRFPDVESFKSYQSEGRLLKPEVVAKTLFNFLELPERINKVDYSIRELLS